MISYGAQKQMKHGLNTQDDGEYKHLLHVLLFVLSPGKRSSGFSFLYSLHPHRKFDTALIVLLFRNNCLFVFYQFEVNLQMIRLYSVGFVYTNAHNNTSVNKNMFYSFFFFRPTIRIYQVVASHVFACSYIK